MYHNLSFLRLIHHRLYQNYLNSDLRSLKQVKNIKNYLNENIDD